MVKTSKKKKIITPMQGTRTDLVPTADVPNVTVSPQPNANPELLRQYPELANLQFQANKIPVTPEQQVKQDVQQKGGYIDATGKYIPPTEPTTHITFNKDGTVLYKTKQGQEYNLTRDEYDTMLGKSKGKYTQNLAEIKAIESGAIEQARIQQAAQQLGLNDQQVAAIQSGLVQAPIEWGQALTAGGANILPSAIAGAGTGLAASLIGAKTGAIAGTAISPGVGTAIGAGVGLLAGLTSGILSNIKKQQKGQISASQDVLTNAKRNMRRLASLAAKDPSNADVYVQAYNDQLAQVYRAQAKIKLETQGNLNKFMEDGVDILSDFELFLAPNGQAALYRRQLELALVSGVAPQLSVEDFA